MTSAFIKSFKGFDSGSQSFQVAGPLSRIPPPDSASVLFNSLFLLLRFLLFFSPPFILCFSFCFSPARFIFSPFTSPSRARFFFFSPFPRKLDSCFQFCSGLRKGSGAAFLCFFHFVFDPVETLVSVLASTFSPMPPSILLFPIADRHETYSVGVFIVIPLDRKLCQNALTELLS